MRQPGTELERLVKIMARLRAEGGCPWDREQDLRSLRPYLIEEAYEVLDEMDRVSYGGAWKPLCEELGDLLFQIVFHAQLATELGEFTMADVSAAIADKIVSRHPHVFGEERVAGAEQVLQNWAKLKAAERKKKTGSEGSVLDGVPTGAPALQRAERLTEKASRVGFDWPDLQGVRGKLDEEMRELDEAIASKDRDAMEHELGDVLFSLANVARFINTPPEDALRQANARFVRRFQVIEEGLRARGVPFGEATLEQMEELWQQAKKAHAQLPPPVHAPRAAVTAFTFPSVDLRATGHFWNRAAEVLGWRLRAPMPDGVVVDAGAFELRFVAASGTKSAPTAPGPAGSVVSIETGSRRAVEHLRKQLVDIGGSVTEVTADASGEHAFTFSDPSQVSFRIFARG